jgi:small subunit ribosomal protein S6
MFIFDSNKYARDQAGLPAEVEKMITDAEGEVLVSRLWEERRLAYAIKGQRKGTYWLIYFRAPTSSIVGLNRKCELNDGILRHLVLKIHPQLVEPILAHAAGRVIGEGDESTAEPQEPQGAAIEEEIGAGAES